MTLRQKYQPILDKLSARVDQACQDWVEKGDDRALTEYNSLVEEICEIKEAIIQSEKNHKWNIKD